jgi:myo-inositol-1(or 4)-monophosphatase
MLSRPILRPVSRPPGQGAHVLMEMLGRAEVWEKGPGDLVTQADLESQRTIEDYLLQRFPTHVFLGEESKPKHSAPEGFCWIVDPLDGTTNFVHQLRSFAVSVALRYRKDGVDEIVAGTVYDPTTDECFSAGWGKGATLNQKPIRVSPCQSLDQALVVFSMTSQIARTDPQVKRLLNVLPYASSIRRLGSATLNLCYVACGRTDAYWATSLKIWDVAAGWLIAKEAGAILKDFADHPLTLDRPHFCLTASEELFDELKQYLDI